MEFKSALFAIIIVGVVVIATGIIVNQWGGDYGEGTVSDLSDYNRLTNTSDAAESQKGNINPQSGEASSDFETETFRGGYGIITNIYSSFRVVFGNNGMIDNVTERFGLPDYIRQALVTMIMIAITFTIIAIVFRLGRTSA